METGCSLTASAFIEATTERMRRKVNRKYCILPFWAAEELNYQYQATAIIEHNLNVIQYTKKRKLLPRICNPLTVNVPNPIIVHSGLSCCDRKQHYGLIVFHII